MIFRTLALLSGLGLAACSGTTAINDPFGVATGGGATAIEETVTPGKNYLDDGSVPHATRIEYDVATDTLIVESLPFDHPQIEGRYDRAPAYDTGGNRAFISGAGSEVYLAFLKESRTGNVAGGVVATGGYFDHGYRGAFYGRNTSVTLPTSGLPVYYNGDYVGLRTVNDGTSPNTISGGEPIPDIVTADVAIEADFADGYVRGGVRNRQVNGNADPIASITFTDTKIQGTGFKTGVIDATQGSPTTGADLGTLEGLFGGPNGEEVIGILMLEYDNIRETGVFSAEK